jgi:hypothetical protein
MSITQVTATSIVAIAKAHSAGIVDVVVTNPGGESGRLAGGFTYVEVPYVITSSASAVAAGATLSATWTAPIGGPGDWVGLFRIGDASTDYTHGWWTYTQGAASGTFTLAAPGQPGVYEFRYLLDDGYVDVARSSPVTVR